MLVRIELNCSLAYWSLATHTHHQLDAYFHVVGLVQEAAAAAADLTLQPVASRHELGVNMCQSHSTFVFSLVLVYHPLLFLTIKIICS